MRRRFLALLLLAVVLLVSPVPSRTQEAEGEILVPGPPLERPMAAGEKHGYRVEVSGDPILVTTEQLGINLVLEVQGPTGRFTTDGSADRWGAEVLVLESAGPYRIEVRPREQSVGPGRYAIQVQAMPLSSEEDLRRHAALSLLSRAGQEAFERTPAARGRALASYREAQAAFHALGERRWEAEALSVIGRLEQEASEPRSAVADYLEAAALWRELAEPRREAAILNRLGVTRLQAGEIEPAREAFQAAMILWPQVRESFDEEETRSNLCYLEQTVGTPSAARSCYEESLAFFRASGDRGQEARILNNLGGIYDFLGDPDAALDHYGKALTIRHELGDRLGEAQTLGNIGVIHRALGEWQEALRIYDQEREILVPLDDRSLKGVLLNNLGFAYNSLGDPQRALSLLEAALKLRRETADGRGEISTLNSLGGVWRSLGDLDRALQYHQQALAQAIRLEDRRQEATSRLRLAEVQLDRGDPVAARRELVPALTFFQTTGNRRSEAQALDLQGRALALAGRPQEALPVLQGVLALRRTLRDRAGEADGLRVVASVERSLGRLDEAQAHVEEAVAKVEALRTGFVSAELRAAFLATQRRAYSLLIDLLMDRGQDRAALKVSERARARSLLDVLHAGNTSAGGNAVPAALLARRHSLRQRVNAKVFQQLRQTSASADDAQGQEIEELLAELDGLEAEIRRHDSRYAALSDPQPMGPEDIGRLLDPGTLLLEYSLGEERSFLWAIGATSFGSYVLPPQKEIDSLARTVYDELSTVEAGVERRDEAAASLARVLLGPVWNEAKRANRLIIVPDAALHLIPFGPLQVPASGQTWDEPGKRIPLLEHAEVAYLPSTTTLALARQRLDHRPPAPKRAAVFADPVFAPNDSRLADPPAASLESSGSTPTRSGAGGDARAEFERLPWSRKEAEAIAGLAPPGTVRTAFDLDASREAALSGELRDYRVIHFATHGVVDTRNPELSGLVLSLVDATRRPREGFLGLSDVYELDLRADLVVLSGCRTALGKEVRGEGLMGLTRGFLYAGVPRIVASLWPVQDRTTADLMERFYQLIWRDGLPPAAALREAQLWLLRRDRRNRDPYSWAGFVLQGDWR